MIGRRTFFAKLATLAGIVALAPQLAFRQKLDLPVVKEEMLPWMARIEAILDDFKALSPPPSFIHAIRDVWPQSR